MCYVVPEPMEFNGKTITPQNLYVALFVIGMLFFLRYLPWSMPLYVTNQLH